MPEDSPSSQTKPTGFWNTTLGTITKITALVSAISGLILAVQPLFRAKEKKVDPAILIDSNKPIPPTKDSAIEVANPPLQNIRPVKEFTLTRDQQQVFNDLDITLTLPDQQLDPTNTVRIRLWRNIEQPISDTAFLDPSAPQPGVSYLLFRLNAITPVSIPDGRQFRFILSNAILTGKRVESVEVKMYKN